MADDLAVDVFKAARTQLGSTVRWHLIVLAALAWFSVAVVAPFSAKTAEKAAIDAGIAERRATIAAIEPILGKARAFRDVVQAASEQTTEGLLADLVARFQRLDAIVAALSGMGEADAVGAAGAAAFRLPPQPQQIQQQLPQTQSPQQQQIGPDSQRIQPAQQQELPLPPLPPLPPTEPGGQWTQQPPGQQFVPLTLPMMPPELRALIARSATDPDAAVNVTDALVAYIDADVITPAFDTAAAAWRSEQRPAIDADADALLQAIDAAGSAPATAAALAETRARAVALRDRADELVIAPPADTEWWRTVAGKGESLAEMTQGLAAGIEDAARSQVSLAALQAEGVAAVSEGERRSQALAGEIDRLEAEAAALQEQLGEIGRPLRLVAFRLSVLAPLLPLVIALASGVATLMTAEALRKMRLAVTLAEAQRASLRPWLADAAGGTRARMTLRALLVALLLAAWILAIPRLTAGHLELALPAPAAVLIPAQAITAAALAILLACRGWLWLQADRALAVAGARRP